MPGEVEIPEEAIEAGIRAASDQLGGIRHDTIIRERIEGVLQAAAPSLRAQGAEEAKEDLERTEAHLEAAERQRDEAETKLSQALAAGLSDKDRGELERIAKLIDSFQLNLSEHNDAAFLRKLAAPKEGRQA